MVKAGLTQAHLVMRFNIHACLNPTPHSCTYLDPYPTRAESYPGPNQPGQTSTKNP